MAIKVSKFVIQNENKPEGKLKKSSKPETIKEDADFILLTQDGTLKVEKSQYTMDMLGVTEEQEYINRKNNKKE